MDCPNCAHDQFSVGYELSRYRVVRCRKCRLLYNRDFPEPQALSETFDERYYREVQREAFAHVGDDRRRDASRAIYEQGLGLVPTPAAGGRLLDVGCAFGVFLELAISHGWAVSGVEISPYSSQYARERRGLDVFTGDLARAPLPATSFDVVTLWDVIEHVRDVRGTIRRARQLLRGGGHIVLTTDNFGGLIARLGSTIYRATLGSVRYPVERLFIRYNSCYLTSTDLCAILEAEGFDVTAVRGIDYPVEKINLTGAEAAVVRLLYAAGTVTRMTSQILVVGRAR